MCISRFLTATIAIVACMGAWGSVVCAQSVDWKADTDGFAKHALPLLTNFCIECHGNGSAEGEFDVQVQLSPDMSSAAIAAKWAEVVNVLNSHEMPPEDSKQPNAAAVAELVDWVTAQMLRAEQASRSAKVVLRRLNRAEYRNTIRDLLGVDFDVSALPEDAAAGGFDNNGAALNFSPLHSEVFYQAANDVLHQALEFGEQPASIRWRFEPESGDSDRNRVRYGENNAIVNGGQNPVVGPGRLIRVDAWNKKINARDFKVPNPGPYVVRVRAGSRVPDREEVVAAAEKILRERYEEQLRKSPDRKQWLQRDLDADLEHFRQARIYEYGPARMRVTVHLDGQPQVIGEADVTGGFEESEMSILEFPVMMTTDKAGITIEYAYSVPSQLENFWMQSRDGFARPEMLVDWIELEGPVHPQWPPETTTRWLPSTVPEEPTQQSQLASDILNRLMPLAYRRPVTKEEVESKLQLYQSVRTSTESFPTAIIAAMTSVLISPNFLYLVEPTTDPDAPVTDHEIASRLSYFLWSSMPDETLFRLASQGRLKDRLVRAQQIDRMLSDRRSEALVDNFAAQWLGLREVGNNPPARDLFPRYDDHVEESMVRESKSFFREVLQNDLSLDCFIDSDFMMINERLARYYEVDDVSGEKIRGDEIRKVQIDRDVPRGGVLTHASVLSTTSNGTRTTPVRRGTWVLKTILDADPGLPVANAGEISPKVPGIDKATVRQRLEIHRELTQCARCHDKIDPLGFALENFDAAGQWRTQEGFGYKGRIGESDPVIDATGMLPDGTSIDGIEGLKTALLQRKTDLHRSLANKMFTYALGREMTLTDRPAIERTLKLLSSERDDMRTLIKAIVTSDTFVQR
jgi:hypothetical protein